MRILFLISTMIVSLSAQKIEKLELNFGDSMKEHQDKSLAGALSLSLLVPGTGEFYLGHQSRSQWFWSTEVLSWVSLIFSYQYSENTLDRMYSFAQKNANVTGLTRDEDALQILGEYRSRSGIAGLNVSPDAVEDYNQDQLRKGENVNSQYPSSLNWDWGSSEMSSNTENFDRYRDLLKQYRQSKMAFQISIGALALGRILSLVDVFHLYRQGNSGFTLNSGTFAGESHVEVVVTF